MLTETRDAALVNGFASHPDIALGVDFSGAFRDTAVFLFGAFGGFVAEWTAPRTYEAHVMLTKAGRGPWGFAAVRQFTAMMSGRADRLWARIDPERPEIAVFARRGGFREVEPMTLWTNDEPKRWRIFEWSR